MHGRDPFEGQPRAGIHGDEYKCGDCLDGSNEWIDIQGLRLWKSRGDASRIYETPDGRWFLDAPGVPFLELPARNVAKLVLNWGWTLSARLKQAIAEGEAAAFDARPKLPLAVLEPHCPVVLTKPAEAPLILGVRVKPLTAAQFDAVNVLVLAWPEGLHLSELNRRSKFGDPRHNLRRARRSAPEWEPVIRFPGRPYGRYRIAVPA